MIRRFFSRYGLATHLAMLASVPLALTPFLSTQIIGSVVLWFTLLALIWLFIEPSLRSGEHLSDARFRVRINMLHDPIFWFMLAVSLLALVCWCNSAVCLKYNPEEVSWVIQEADWPMLLASVGNRAFLPFALILALWVLLMGLRHGMGQSARNTFVLIASLFSGIGGLLLVISVGVGDKAFVDLMSKSLVSAPLWSSFFAIWLLLGVTSGAQAEGMGQKYARIPVLLGIVGNLSALVFFAHPMVAVLWLLVFVLFTIFLMVYLNKESSNVAMAHLLSLVLLGILLVICLFILFVPTSIMLKKLPELDPTLVFTESFWQANDSLSRIARQMWMENPWTGVGYGAFGLHVQFLAEKADWALLGSKVAYPYNSYWLLLSEWGILGCVLMVVGLGLLIYSYVARLIGGIKFMRSLEDRDAFVVSVHPFVWCVPLCLVIMSVIMVFTPVVTVDVFLLMGAFPLALAAASFPKVKESVKEQDKSSK